MFVASLTAATERLTREWNIGATPSDRVKTTSRILAETVRKPQDDSGPGLEVLLHNPVGQRQAC